MTLSFYAFPGICYNPSKPGIRIVQVSILLDCLKFTEIFHRGSLCKGLITETSVKSLIREKKNVVNAGQAQHEVIKKKLFTAVRMSGKLHLKDFFFLVCDVHKF